MRPVMMVVLLVTGVLAGCVGEEAPLGEEGPEEPIIAGPTRDFEALREHYASLGEDAICYAWVWDPEQEQHPEDPAPVAVNWSRTDEDERPVVYDDLLYSADYLFKNGSIPRGGWFNIISSYELCQNGLDWIKEEYERQSVPLPELCCWASYEGEHYGLTANEIHVFDYGESSRHGWSNTTYHNSTVLLSAGIPGELVFQLDAEEVNFTVKPTNRVFVAEVAWDDPLADLSLHLRAPGSEEDEWDQYTEPAPLGEPVDRHSMTIWKNETEVWPGEWTLGVFAHGVAVNVEYRVAVTVWTWYESVEPWDEGFTAL